RRGHRDTGSETSRGVARGRARRRRSPPDRGQDSRPAERMPSPFRLFGCSQRYPMDLEIDLTADERPWERPAWLRRTIELHVKKVVAEDEEPVLAARRFSR